MVGCTNKEEGSLASSNNADENTIKKLEQKIEEQQAIMEEHEKKLTTLDEWEQLKTQLSLLDESNVYLQNRLYLLEAVINETTTSKTAILNSFEINEKSLDMNITYMNSIVDEDAPNNYRLIESGEGTKVISIREDVPIWLLKNPGESVQVTWEEFAIMSGFLKLYEKNGKIVFISEIYLP